LRKGLIDFIKNPLVIIAVLLIISFFIPTPFVMVSPGMSQQLDRMVNIEETAGQASGSFQLVTIKQQQGIGVPFLLYGAFHPGVEIHHREEVVPPDMDKEEYREIIAQMMEESKQVAKVVALRRAGYDVEVRGKGIEVHDFLEDSPAEEILRKGDIITEVDGDKVNFANEVVVSVQDREVGQKVGLTVKRDEEIKHLSVPTTEHTEDPSLPAMGVYITTLGWEADFPFEINIDAGEIGGPSAGLMFVLEVLNQLTDKDLTGGHTIAGTGTIDIDGQVGNVGGVKQKVNAAENKGAKIFMVPSGNYREAAAAAGDIRVIPVGDVEEAINELNKLEPAASSEVGFLYRDAVPDQVAIFDSLQLFMVHL